MKADRVLRQTRTVRHRSGHRRRASSSQRRRGGRTRRSAPDVWARDRSRRNRRTRIVPRAGRTASRRAQSTITLMRTRSGVPHEGGPIRRRPLPTLFTSEFINSRKLFKKRPVRRSVFSTVFSSNWASLLLVFLAMSERRKCNQMFKKLECC